MVEGAAFIAVRQCLYKEFPFNFHGNSPFAELSGLSDAIILAWAAIKCKEQAFVPEFSGNTA